MRLPTTITLLIMTAGLGWFVARNDFARQPEPASESRLLFSFDKQKADKIEISGKEQKVILQRRDGTWWITSPVKDRANPLLAEAIMETLKRIENLETLARDDFSSGRLKHAGLNDTSITLAVSGGGRKLASCQVGSRAALESSVYLTVSPGREGSTMHAARLPFGELSKSQDPAAKSFDFFTLLQTTPEAWRDPALLRIKVDSVRRITFSAGSGLMEFKREPGQPWELAKPLQTRASDERVNAVLSTLLLLQAKPAGKAPNLVASPATDSLPGMKVSFQADGLDKPIEAVLQVGTDPQADIHTTVSDRPGSFFVPAQAALIWKLQPNDLRETHLARLDPEAVTALRIRSATHPEILLDRNSDTWMLTRMGRSAPANQDRVLQLFGDLNAAEIREFAADAANNLEPFGLHQPFLEVEWRERDKVMRLRFGINAGNRIHCQYDDEPFVYRVHPSLPGAIATDSVKWQGLGILNLSTLAVRRILIAEGTSPPVTLLHDPMTGSWQGEVAGKDVSSQIVRGKAAALLKKLAGLNAETWVTDRTAGYAALKNPALTVQLLVVDPAKPNGPPAAHVLAFASTSAGQKNASFYGRLDDNPDLFLLSREQYHEIVSPVVH